MMAGMAVQRIKREFKEVSTSEEVCANFSEIVLNLIKNLQNTK